MDQLMARVWPVCKAYKCEVRVLTGERRILAPANLRTGNSTFQYCSEGTAIMVNNLGLLSRLLKKWSRRFSSLVLVPFCRSRLLLFFTFTHFHIISSLSLASSSVSLYSKCV